MANSKQALKRHRQSLVAQKRNRFYMSSARTFLKKARLLLDAGDKSAAEPAVRKAASYLDHVVTRGTMPKGRADRLKSRLAKRLNSL